METETSYELRKEGWVRHVHSLQHVCMSADLLKDIMPKVNIHLSLVIPGEGQYGNISIIATNQGTSLYAKLNFLVMDTWWLMVVTDNVFIPGFKSGQGTRLKFNWTPPPSMTLALVVALDSKGYFDSAYLAAFNKDGKIYRLPFSNIYEHGGLCLIAGGHPSVNAPTMLGRFQVVLGLVNNNPWANDLLQPTDRDNAPKLVRVTTEGKTLEPTAKDWTKACMPISNEFLNSVEPKNLI